MDHLHFVSVFIKPGGVSLAPIVSLYQKTFCINLILRILAFQYNVKDFYSDWSYPDKKWWCDRAVGNLFVKIWAPTWFLDSPDRTRSIKIIQYTPLIHNIHIKYVISHHTLGFIYIVFVFPCCCFFSFLNIFLLVHNWLWD